MTPAEQHRNQAVKAREKLRQSLAAYPSSDGGDTFVDRLCKASLEGVIADLTAVIDGKCPEDPARLLGAPMGQYHCPRCGCMVVAGMDGHPHDEGCWYGLGDEDWQEWAANLADAAESRRTASGHELTDAYVEELAAEAEAGYDLDKLVPRLADVIVGEEHSYWSTWCRHGNHDPCRATELAPGVPRKPSQCKSCAAPCRCWCHIEKVQNPNT